MTPSGKSWSYWKRASTQETLKERFSLKKVEKVLKLQTNRFASNKNNYSVTRLHEEPASVSVWPLTVEPSGQISQALRTDLLRWQSRRYFWASVTSRLGWIWPLLSVFCCDMTSRSTGWTGQTRKINPRITIKTDQLFFRTGWSERVKVLRRFSSTLMVDLDKQLHLTPRG